MIWNCFFLYSGGERAALIRANRTGRGPFTRWTKVWNTVVSFGSSHYRRLFFFEGITRHVIYRFNNRLRRRRRRFYFLPRRVCIGSLHRWWCSVLVSCFLRLLLRPSCDDWPFWRTINTLNTMAECFYYIWTSAVILATFSLGKWDILLSFWISFAYFVFSRRSS